MDLGPNCQPSIAPSARGLNPALFGNPQRPENRPLPNAAGNADHTFGCQGEQSAL